MIPRTLSKLILRAAKQYPVVTITGPRQSGKSTLCKALFPQKAYVNLEDPELRSFATQDPKTFLKKYKFGCILDEFQRAPELASAIQVLVDEKKKNGAFILTGSQSLEISQSISQSLAGRSAIFKLLPFSLSELKSYKKKKWSTDQLLFQGFYPRIYDQKLDPSEMLANYVETYLERDLRQLIHVKNLALFQKFLRICAGRVGQLVNFQSLGSEVGVSHVTITSWISILQASFIIFLLEPHHNNLNKRLIKSPKLYFYDVGLASYLLRIRSPEQIESHPLRGSLFENMVIADVQKWIFNNRIPLNLFFYRDKEDHEVDLLLEGGRFIQPIEIKSASTFHPEMAAGLRYLQKKMGSKIIDPTLVYDGNETREFQGIKLAFPASLSLNIK